MTPTARVWINVVLVAATLVTPDTLNAEQATALDLDDDGDLDIDDAIALTFE